MPVSVLATLALCAIHLTTGLPVQTQTCSGPADIVFMVDTSNSIHPRDFNTHVKQFVNDVVQTFHVGKGKEDSRVGLMLFGSNAYLQFYLRSYQTVKDVQAAVNRTRFRGGNTYTHKALQFASRVMFSERYGARDGVAKMLVVLTDGKSINTKKTVMEAQKLKETGVDIFTIGVGSHVDKEELTAMSSGEQFTFQVKDFKVLESITMGLTSSQCQVLGNDLPTTTAPKVTSKPTTISTTTMSTTTMSTTTMSATTTSTRPTTTTTTVESTTFEELPQKDNPLECHGKPADVYFLLDASSSVYVLDFNHQVLPFVRDVVATFKISPRHTRVGVVTFSNNVDHAFGLSEYTDLQSLHSAIHPDTVEYLTGGTNTGDAINYVTKKFSSMESRQGVAQVIITVTDGRSQKPKMTAAAAKEARQKGIYMFAIGVGKNVDDQELKDISSNPDKDFVYSVDTFKGLKSVANLLASKTCSAVLDKTQVRPTSKVPLQNVDKYDCSSQPINVVFTYTSRDALSTNTDVILDTITDFSTSLQTAAPHVKVGVVTEPCLAGTTSLTSVGQFQKIRQQEKSDAGYPRIITKLREEIFTKVPQDENKMAVLFMDRHTDQLGRLQEEVRKLRQMNTEIVVVAVGKVDDYVIDNLVSRRTSTNVINVDSYEALQNTHIPLMKSICNTNMKKSDIYPTDKSYNMKTEAPARKYKSPKQRRKTLPPLPPV